MDKKYDRFKTEEELLKSVLHSLSYDVYPKVSAIGGKRINPAQGFNALLHPFVVLIKMLCG